MPRSLWLIPAFLLLIAVGAVLLATDRGLVEGQRAEAGLDATTAAAASSKDRPATPLPAGAEARALTGEPLFPPPLPPQVEEAHERRLTEARQAAETMPGDVEALIWLGRRTAYLGRYREAIAIYDRALAAHPDEPRLYRHRGHRYLTLRRLDDAVADFERAAAMVAGQPDQVEPDGLPNARGIPTSTLKTNVSYHLGLAHYLRGDFAPAAAAYQRCLGAAENPDMLVAATYWAYLALRRLGRDAEATALLTPIDAELEVIENDAYHRLLLVYQGELEPGAVLAAGGEEATGAEAAAPLEEATLGYGVGAWHLVEGRAETARALFERVVAGGQWPAFGHLAAEAELARAPR